MGHGTLAARGYGQQRETHPCACSTVPIAASTRGESISWPAAPQHPRRGGGGLRERHPPPQAHRATQPRAAPIVRDWLTQQSTVPKTRWKRFNSALQHQRPPTAGPHQHP